MKFFSFFHPQKYESWILSDRRIGKTGEAEISKSDRRGSVYHAADPISEVFVFPLENRPLFFSQLDRKFFHRGKRRENQVRDQEMFTKATTGVGAKLNRDQFVPRAKKKQQIAVIFTRKLNNSRILLQVQIIFNFRLEKQKPKGSNFSPRNEANEKRDQFWLES